MSYLVNLALEGRAALVVGGGEVAARKVLNESGKLTVDHIAANTLEAQINDITVWVNMQATDPSTS